VPNGGGLKGEDRGLVARASQGRSWAGGGQRGCAAPARRGASTSASARPGRRHQPQGQGTRSCQLIGQAQAGQSAPGCARRCGGRPRRRPGRKRKRACGFPQALRDYPQGDSNPCLLAENQSPAQANLLPPQGDTPSAPSACTPACTSEGETVQADALAVLAAALRRLSREDRARLAALLLGQQPGHPEGEWGTP
jgi:hypothetical protein